jgi:hypothetical protein
MRRQHDTEEPPASTEAERHVAGSLAQLVCLLARDAAREWLRRNSQEPVGTVSLTDAKPVEAPSS